MGILHIRIIRFRIDVKGRRERPTVPVSQKTVVPQMVIAVADHRAEYGTMP